MVMTASRTRPAMRVLDEPLVMKFDASVLMTAVGELPTYFLRRNGIVHGVVQLQVTRIVDGEPSDDRSYEVWCDTVVSVDGEVLLVPYWCECMDHSTRKRLCKHTAMVCLWWKYMTRDDAEERATEIEVEIGDEV